MITKKSVLATALTVAALGACGLASAATPPPEVKPLEIRYDWGTRETPSVTRYPSTCPVHIVTTVDARQNKDTIGGSFCGPLVAGEMTRWVSDGLLGLKNHGFETDEVATGDAPRDGVTVSTTLTRAYTWQIGLKIFGMVAVKARFVDKNGVVQEKYYRAHGDKTNMWGADSEHVTTLNYGLNNLLPAVAADLATLCKGGQVEPYTYAGPDPVQKK